MRKIFVGVTLVLLSFIPLIDLFHPGLPITHDGQDHVARIANFYRNLEEGNIIPRWAGNLNWGYGHPILMFLYPLPSYIASLFHFLGFSFVDSVKIVFGLAFVLSGVSMYIWAREAFGKAAGFIAAGAYMLAPYRFVDLYVRGAIGEHVAFIFPPLIFYFLLKLSQKYSYWYILGGSMSIAGLILSHNAISLMFLPLIFLYGIYLFMTNKEKKRLQYQYIMIMLFGLGVAAFFWMPAFFEGKYTLRDIVTKDEYVSRFVTPESLFFGQWNYGISGQFTTQVGIVQWLFALAALPCAFLLKKKNNSVWMVTAGFVFIFGLTLFIITQQSLFLWETISTLQKFQFPWRFLSVTVFATAVFGGIIMYTLPKRIQIFSACLLLSLLLLLNKDYWHAKDFLEKQEDFYTGIYPSTTDTGESSPIWSVRFMEKEPSAHMEIVNGDGSIKEMKRVSTYHEYNVEAKERLRIKENTLYFPGWEVFIDDQKTEVEFQDPSHRGIMTFFVDKGIHTIIIKFEETKLRMLANMITGISLGSLLLLGILSRKLVWRRSR